MWSHLLTLALERGSSSVFGLPSLVSNDTEDWKCLLLAVGSDIKELSLPLPNRWLSEEQGTTEEHYTQVHESTISKYFSTTHEDNGNQSTLVITVPLGITKSKQLALISDILKNVPNPMPIKSAKAKKPLTAQRLRSAPLMKGLGLLWGKAVNPQFHLWRLGASCKISKKYQHLIDPIKSKPTASNDEARRTLAVLTHRMLEKAQLTAEHAARGRFPCDDKCALPFFEPDDVYSRLIIYKPSLKRNNGKSKISRKTDTQK